MFHYLVMELCMGGSLADCCRSLEMRDVAVGVPGAHISRVEQRRRSEGKRMRCKLLLHIGSRPTAQDSCCSALVLDASGVGKLGGGAWAAAVMVIDWRRNSAQ